MPVEEVDERHCCDMVCQRGLSDQVGGAVAMVSSAIVQGSVGVNVLQERSPMVKGRGGVVVSVEVVAVELWAAVLPSRTGFPHAC